MAGRELPPPSRFAADDGAPDPALAAALARQAAGEAAIADVVTALARARVLVPVLAVEHEDGPHPGEPGAGAPAADTGAPSEPFAEARHASAGVVAVAAPDGRTALPVFSSVAALAAWHPSARPMPAEGPRAAAAALGEGWDLLVLDPGGATAVVVPRPAVHALAQGRAWTPAVQHGQVTDGVHEAVRAAVRHSAAQVLAVDVVPGRRAEVAVVLTLAAGLSRAALDRALADVAGALAADAGVTTAVDSLELRPVRQDEALPIAGKELRGGSGGASAPGRERGSRWRRAPGRPGPRG